MWKWLKGFCEQFKTEQLLPMPAAPEKKSPGRPRYAMHIGTICEDPGFKIWHLFICKDFNGIFFQKADGFGGCTDIEQEALEKMIAGSQVLSITIPDAILLMNQYFSEAEKKYAPCDNAPVYA